MEDPQAFAGPCVVPPHVALDVAHALRVSAGPVRRADDDDAAGDDGRGVQPDFAGDRVDLLVVLELQIDDPRVPESRHGASRSRVERDQLVAGRDVDDALVLSVRPVREAAAGKLPRSRVAAGALIEAEHPSQLPCGGVQRHDRAPGAARGIECAVDHQRGGLELELGPRPEVVGLEAPGDVELAEVAGVDLIERRVPRVAEIAPVRAPFAACRPGLPGDAGAARDHRESEARAAPRETAHRSTPRSCPRSPDVCEDAQRSTWPATGR
jgi:hypothetical protein